MSRRTRRHEGKRSALLAIVAWISPPLALCWAILSAPWTRKDRILAVSLCGNLLFLVTLVWGYMLSEDEIHEGVGLDAVMPSGLAQCSQGPLLFGRAVSSSELAMFVPNAIYVVFRGVVRARFEFADEQLDRLQEITVSDGQGRPWVDASLTDGTLIYNRYSNDWQVNPEATLSDDDGDGVPDQMIDWTLRERLVPEQAAVWHKVEGLGPENK